MLVLSRKTMESVVVGEAGGFTRLLKVTVLEVRNGMVRLGFEADANVPVHRSEVWEHIKTQNWVDDPTRSIPQSTLGEALKDSPRQVRKPIRNRLTTRRSSNLAS